MKKMIMKGKKAAAAMLLAAIAVCAVAPTVEAYSYVKRGWRSGESGAWYSHTEVYAYETNGVSAKSTAGAQMPGTVWRYDTNSPRAYKVSYKSETMQNANHAYGVNGQAVGTWTEN